MQHHLNHLNGLDYNTIKQTTKRKIKKVSQDDIFEAIVCKYSDG